MRSERATRRSERAGREPSPGRRRPDRARSAEIAGPAAEIARRLAAHPGRPRGPGRTGRAAEIARRLAAHPGRGGCGVGAVADLTGRASHDLIDLALRALCCLEHRGGTLEETGDGAGLLLTTDRDYFARFIAPGRRLPEGHRLAVGVFFFPHGEKGNLPHWQHEIDATLRRGGLAPLGWRHVPVDPGALGKQARESRRDVWQLLIGEGMIAHEDLDRAMYRVKATLEQKIRDLYVVSFSPRTLVYKALATGEQLPRFYPDLRDPDLHTEAVVFHRRFSTNTFSNWYLAQVFRVLCHNGEINTIKANRNAVLNLEAELGLGPILMPQGSDSADLDRVVELFVAHGVPLLETLCRLMPMAWTDVPDLSPEGRHFFEGVQRALASLGAWEGPAAIVATDGRYLVGALDRMGLRPLRYTITRSGRLILGSELGAVPVPPEDIVETGQFDPGESLALHLPDRRIFRPSEVLGRVLAETPINFDELSEHRLVPLPRASDGAAPAPAEADRGALGLFGWTPERTRTARHMAQHGKEPISSMGFDRPLPVLSALRPPLTKYFKQIVAVVTNPPIDPIREGSAFDLTVRLGSSPSVHADTPVYDPRPQWLAPSPFLTEEQFLRVRDAAGDGFPRPTVLDCTFEDRRNGPASGAKAISRRIAELCRTAIVRIKRREASILILSDREAVHRKERLPLPMVLMTSALHNALVSEGGRRDASIVVESGEIQEGHDGAVFLANGATALFPYLLYQARGPEGTVENLTAALDETLKRVMSKMGICSADGYRGSRLFEAVGVGPTVVEYYLPGVVSRVGGIELEDIYDDIRARRANSGARPPRENDVSIYRKEVWQELQTTARGHDPDSYRRFLALLEATPPIYLRDLVRLKPAAEPLPLERVATEEEIVAACLRGAAMSHGALHRVAHRAIAAAFNSLGAASNCGEGGTGAASQSSIEHAGLPLERALSEVQQALVVNGVRERVRLRADGGLKSGFDIAVTMALGADECALGTALMVAEQCIYCHGCANGLCPAGITTQSDLVARRLMTVKRRRPKDDLLPDQEEDRFEDARNGVVRFFRALAGDIRRKLAALGLARPEDLVGRVDLLERKPLPPPPAEADPAGGPGRARPERVDLAGILTAPEDGAGRPHGWSPAGRLPLDPTSDLNARIAAAAAEGAELRFAIANTDRAAGATLAGRIASGAIVPPAGGFTIRFSGYAGQALGFACTEGMRIEFEGFANDTVGEAMGGGTIVVRLPRAIPAEVRGTLSAAGNAAGYGATGGRLYIEGRAGQRVGVRNSGATIVVEGAGKYAFEYMTGGVGVVLGPIGSVIASGLTGGLLYLFDHDGRVAGLVHPSARALPLDEGDAALLGSILDDHARETGSHRARSLIERWSEERGRFLKVVANL